MMGYEFYVAASLNVALSWSAASTSATSANTMANSIYGSYSSDWPARTTPSAMQSAGATSSAAAPLATSPRASKALAAPSPLAASPGMQQAAGSWQLAAISSQQQAASSKQQVAWQCRHRCGRTTSARLLLRRSNDRIEIEIAVVGFGLLASAPWFRPHPLPLQPLVQCHNSQSVHPAC